LGPGEILMKQAFLWLMLLGCGLLFVATFKAVFEVEAEVKQGKRQFTQSDATRTTERAGSAKRLHRLLQRTARSRVWDDASVCRWTFTGSQSFSERQKSPFPLGAVLFVSST
jgi:hypothetical protein